MKPILAGIIALLIAGCATTFQPWKLSDIQEGMEREQIVAILGEPDYTVEKDGSEYLYYSYREDLSPMSEAAFSDEKAMERRGDELLRTLKEYKYEVIMVDGKMINYKELAK